MNDLDRETQFEQRLARLEAEVARLMTMVPGNGAAAAPVGPGLVDGRPWWEATAGAFADDETYEEAMRLGREWRESFRPRPGAKSRSKSAPNSKSPKRVKSGAAAKGKPADGGARHGSR
jgi:hypothetical protein